MTPRIKIDSRMMAAALEKLKTSPQELKRTMDSIMRETAGIAGVELAAATNPPFISESGTPIDGFKTRVMRDHYRSTLSVGGVYANLRASLGQDKANQFWAIYKSGDHAAANDFLRSVGSSVSIVNAFDQSAHNAARKNKGRVPDDHRASTALDESAEESRKDAIANAQAMVGTAKAGWPAAAKDITRSRAGGKSVNWLRRKQKATGIGTLTESNGVMTMTLENTVPWAEKAINSRLMANVPISVMRRFGDRAKVALRAIAKKMNK